MRRHGSLLSQLLVAFSVFAVLIGIAVGVGYGAAVHQSQAAKQLTGHYQVLQEADGKIAEAFTRAHSAILSYSLTREPGFLQPLKQARAQYDHRLATLERRTPPGLRDLVRAQARAGGAWWALAPKIMTVPPRTPAATALLGRSAGLSQAFFLTNFRLELSLTAQVRGLTTTSNRALTTGLVWSGVAVGIALLLVLAGSLSTLRTITWPLRGLTATVRRLTKGDHAARAAVAGSAEVREVAQSVNTQADESDRLRAQEAESNRLRTMAGQAGVRIREHLVAADVVSEVWEALDRTVDADVVYLRLLEDGQLSAPSGRSPPWLLPSDVIRRVLTPPELAELQDLLRVQASRVTQDVQGAEGDRLTPLVRDTLRRAGVQSQLLTPFGVGSDLLGIVIAQRLQPGHTWTAAEVDAVESIAADTGRGLHHARLYEKENRLVEDLKSLDQAKSDFFATVSHELRAPLTSIEGYVEMLGDGEGGPVTADQQRMLEAVDHSAVRLRDLIEDVFTLSKLESGAFTTVMRPVNVAEVIGGAVEQVQPSVAGHGLTLTSGSPPGDLIVDGDAGQLGRVLVNLLSNAVKFTPGGGRITVSAAAEDGSAVIAVSDTGIGIPERDQKELFARFFRASNAVERSIPGTGLGLAIVRTIVANHSGQIDVQSQQDKGTVVTIRLPLQAAHG